MIPRELVEGLCPRQHQRLQNHVLALRNNSKHAATQGERESPWEGEKPGKTERKRRQLKERTNPTANKGLKKVGNTSPLILARPYNDEGAAHFLPLLFTKDLLSKALPLSHKP